MELTIRNDETGAWVLWKGDVPIAVNGEQQYATRALLVEALEGRGLYVSDGGAVSKEKPQPVSKPRHNPRQGKYKESAQRWRAANPEKIAAYREKWKEARRIRYQEDPEYRAHVLASNKETQRKRAARKKQEKSS